MSSFERVNVLGVQFDSITPAQAADAASELNGSSRVVTPNPEIVMAAREDPELMKIINDSELVTADGIGIIYAARILGTPLPGRVTGMDLSTELISRLAEKQGKIYLLGAKPGVAALAGENMSRSYPGLNVVGYHDGYFDSDEDIIADINRCEPDLLLVCLGSPKQERWMASRRELINVKLMMGLGGVLDVYAGIVNRAPVFYQKLGLEWLYRIIRQPSRFKRILKLPKFLLVVLGRRISGKK